MPGTVNTAVYPYGQMGQTLPSNHGYTTVQGYAMPGHHFMQFGGPSVNAISNSPIPTIQAPYPTGNILLAFLFFFFAVLLNLFSFLMLMVNI